MAVIFCYSGTGNSLFAARRIAETLDARVCNMRDAHAVGEVSDDVIGFVFPTYYWGLPKSVRKFIGTLRISNKDAYIFAVATYGGVCAGVCDAVNVLLKRENVKLSYSAKVKMVENFLPAMYCNDSDELWEKSNAEIDKVIEDLSVRKKRRTPSYTAFNGLAQKAYPANKPGCAEKFTVENCTGCELCSKVCPNGNITIENGSPKFGENCDLCLGCLNNCPVDAIDYGKSTKGKKRYKNPRIPISVLIEHNSGKQQ